MLSFLTPVKAIFFSQDNNSISKPGQELCFLKTSGRTINVPPARPLPCPLNLGPRSLNHISQKCACNLTSFGISSRQLREVPGTPSRSLPISPKNLLLNFHYLNQCNIYHCCKRFDIKIQDVTLGAYWVAY